MVKQIGHIWMVLGIISLLCIDNAHAYIDPGTGAMLLQALLAAGVAVLAFWRQIKNFVSIHFFRKSADSSKSGDSE